MATKVKKRSERKNEHDEVIGVVKKKKPTLDEEERKKEKIKWLLFLASIICIWFIYKFGNV
jgi:hypothetical protein